jgi:hypothetical protein
MDKLTDEQRDSVKKASTERLRVKLLQSGADEEVVFALDRKQLMDAVAVSMLTKLEGATIGEKKHSKSGKLN